MNQEFVWAYEKNSQEKKPTYLCAPREFLKKMCHAWKSHNLVILTKQASRGVICISVTWSRRTTCAKDHGLYLSYPQINEVGKSDQMAECLLLRSSCRDFINTKKNRVLLFWSPVIHKICQRTDSARIARFLFNKSNKLQQSSFWRFSELIPTFYRLSFYHLFVSCLWSLD